MDYCSDVFFVCGVHGVVRFLIVDVVLKSLTVDKLLISYAKIMLKEGIV